MSFKALLFTRTAAYRHASIPSGIRAIERLASSHNFATFHTEDPAVFTDESFAEYKVIILLQCSGEFLETKEQIDALKKFVRNGGGVVGVHCASFAMESESWYGKLIGAVFEGHPAPETQWVRVADKIHPACQDCLGMGNGPRRMKKNAQGEEGLEWEWLDEWYVFKESAQDIRGRVHVLLKGGLHGEDYPLSWCQEFEGGRSFYTSLGHFDEAYEDEGFLAHLLRGILWVAGEIS
ncbi:hypothetical protein OQA88_7733 [Cercophora sp. LCS_1]